MLAWDSYIPTSDGWEQQCGCTPFPLTSVSDCRIRRRLQVNHLANVQMSLLLLPLLRRTASLGSIPRLVLVSSDTHLWIDLSAEAKSEREIIPLLNDKEYLTQSVLVSIITVVRNSHFRFTKKKEGDENAIPQDEDVKYPLYPRAGIKITSEQPSGRQLRHSLPLQDRTATRIPLATLVDIRHS